MAVSTRAGEAALSATPRYVSESSEDCSTIEISPKCVSTTEFPALDGACSKRKLILKTKSLHVLTLFNRSEKGDFLLILRKRNLRKRVK